MKTQGRNRERNPRIVGTEFGNGGRGKRVSTGGKGSPRRHGPQLPRRVGTERDVERSVSVREYMESWLRSKDGWLSPSTLRGYSGVIQNRFVPALGHHDLSELQRRAIEDMVFGERVSQSPRTVWNELALLRKILKDAVRSGYLDRNLAEQVSMRKPEPPRRRTLSASDAMNLPAMATGTRLFGPVLLALSLGLTLREICALSWEKVDLDKCRLRVDREIVGRSNRLQIVPIPIMRRRVIEFSSLVGDALRALRAEQGNAASERSNGAELSLVCPGEAGKPFNPESLAQLFRRFAQRKGLAATTFSSLRDTCAARMFESGATMLEISAQLGISGEAITRACRADMFIRRRGREILGQRLQAS